MRCKSELLCILCIHSDRNFVAEINWCKACGRVQEIFEDEERWYTPELAKQNKK